MRELIGKLPSFLTSKRFWVALGGVATVILTESGVEEEQATEVVTKIISVAGIVAAWIIGDSLRSTMESRREKLDA